MVSFRILSLAGLIIYFAVLLVSVVHEQRNHTVVDYFFAGRTLPFWALSITFIASWWGAGSTLSTADLAFADGMAAFWYYGVPVLVSTFLMILSAKKIRRVAYLTQGKMMEARYSTSVAKFLSVMILVFMTITAASQMVGIGDFFGTYLKLDYEVAVILGTAVVLVYSIFGGFRGVVLTDIIQFVLLLISALIVFVVAMWNADGFAGIQAASEALNKPDFLNPIAGASKYFMYVITFGCAWMIQANVWQRISAARTSEDARKMTILSFLVFIPLYLIVVFTGMAGICMFDELPQGGVVVGIVLEYLSPLVGSVVFIGISAAIMSTMDSLINTASMTLIMDLSPFHTSEEKKVQHSKYATLLVIIVALFIAMKIRSILEISWLASDIITTGVFVPLVGGFLWKKGNSKGAMASMLCGFLYSMYNLLISLQIPLPSFWQPQSVEQVILGIALSFVIYIVVSLCTKEEDTKAQAFIAMSKGSQDEKS